jgi:hypothetical protein
MASYHPILENRMTDTVNLSRTVPGAHRPGPPAPESVRLLQMLVAPWIAQSLYVAAKFDIADRLAAGPAGVDRLAEESGLHADTLYRMLRTLASVGVFSEPEPRRFALAELGQFLRADVPGTQKFSALLFGEETFRAWADVVHTARTGKPAFERLYGVPFYDYLDQHPESNRIFNRVMGQADVVPPMALAYDWSATRHIVDVGGGSGALVANVLADHPGLTATLFDRREAVDEAGPTLAAAGVTGRCTVVAGSFFDEVPAGGDAYVLSRVLHNWSDERALAILRQLRKAVPPDGRLLIFERLLPDGDVPSIGKVFDLVMLVVLGGRDRSAAEYRKLLDAAGFGVVDEIVGPAEFGRLTCVPV